MPPLAQGGYQLLTSARVSRAGRARDANHLEARDGHASPGVAGCVRRRVGERDARCAEIRMGLRREGMVMIREMRKV